MKHVCIVASFWPSAERKRGAFRDREQGQFQLDPFRRDQQLQRDVQPQHDVEVTAGEAKEN